MLPASKSCWFAGTGEYASIAVYWKVLACVLLVGCGTGCQQLGVLMYHMGVGQQERVEAEFELPKVPTLILVDDDQNLVHPRTALDALVDKLAIELQQRRLVEQVTTNEELAQLRLAYSDLHRRGAREVGGLANADTVIWIQVTRFGLPEDLERVMAEVPFTVTVKVLNARADTRDEVRLWPEQREGKLVEVKVSPHTLRQCADLQQAHETMAAEMAQEIARLFYAHTKEQP